MYGTENETNNVTGPLFCGCKNSVEICSLEFEYLTCSSTLSKEPTGSFSGQRRSKVEVGCVENAFDFPVKFCCCCDFTYVYGQKVPCSMVEGKQDLLKV